MPQTSPLSWPLRLAYATGQMPEGVKSAAFGFFLLFYYNQVLGMSAALASAAIFIALCLDAISDPVVGSWSDTSRSRWGRRHPYMYAAAIPFAACYYLLFAPPQGLSEPGLFVWLLAFTALTRTAMTFFTVPYMAMGAELTNDYDERTLLAALRSVMNLLGMFAVLIGGNQLFFAASDEFTNGQLDPQAYPKFAAACVPLLLLGVGVAAAGTHRRIPQLNSAADGKVFSLRELIASMGMAFRIPSFVALVTASVVFGATTGMVQALIIYTATYFFALSPTQITALFGLSVVGIIVGSLLSRPIAGLIPEKRTLFAAGLSWYAVFSTVVIIARLTGVLPPNEHPLVAPVYFSCAFAAAVGLGLAIPMIGSMVADITDEHERLHGSRQEGIYYAAASFAGKVIGGAGPVMAGLVIDAAGIPPGSHPSAVSIDAVTRFGWLQGPSVLLLTAVSVAAIMFYRISRARHAEILENIRLNSGRKSSLESA